MCPVDWRKLFNQSGYLDNLMMRMSVYITDIYFPGVGNVSNYNLQELNINLLSNCRKLLFIIQDFQRLKEMDWYSLKMCLNQIHGIYKLFTYSKVYNRKLKDITSNYMLFQEKRANFSYMTYLPFWISLVSSRILMTYLPPDFHINFYDLILRKFRVTSATR